MALTVVTWNIEQFGSLRSSNIDNLSAISKIIHAINPIPDIIVLLEIKSSDIKEVCAIAQNLSDYIFSESGGARRYYYVISFYNGLESYVYLYLHKNNLTPLTVAKGKKVTYDDDPQSKKERLLDLVFSRSAQTNSSYDSEKGIFGKEDLILNSFPLFKYKDLKGCRPPAVGFFEYGNEILAIVAWHNMSGNDDNSYTKMIQMTQSYFVTNTSFRVDIGGQVQNVSNILITGDFNLDICGNQGEIDAYNAFTGFTTYITEKTCLEPYLYGKKYSGYDSIYSAGFDNHIFYSPGGITYNASAIIDIPDIYMNHKKRTVKFLETTLFICYSFEEDDKLFFDRLEKYLNNKLAIMNRNKTPTLTADEKKEIIIECMDSAKSLRLKNLEEKLSETKKILDIYFDNFANNLYSYVIGPSNFRGERFGIMKSNYDSMLWGDALFICRRFASDHIPVSITFI